MKKHLFEIAGLGKAPFSFVNVQYLPSTDSGFFQGIGKTGICAYCGQSNLKTLCHVKSADGNEFIVGTSCVHKTCSTKTYNYVNRVEKKIKKEYKLKQEKLLIEKYFSIYKNYEMELKSVPHPNKYFSDKTFWDYTQYIDDGTFYPSYSQKVKIAKMVKKIIA